MSRAPASASCAQMLAIRKQVKLCDWVRRTQGLRADTWSLQVCQLESQLFQHFFPREEEDSGALAPLVDPLCMVLYDMLRPAFIQLQDLDDLCEIVDILLHEACPA